MEHIIKQIRADIDSYIENAIDAGAIEPQDVASAMAANADDVMDLILEHIGDEDQANEVYEQILSELGA